MYGQVTYMALQRLNSPQKLKGWYLQVPARLIHFESSFSPNTYCQNICSSEANRTAGLLKVQKKGVESESQSSWYRL